MKPATESTYRYDVTEFVHRGRKRKIYRREPQGNFQTRRMVAGKDLTKTLDSPIATIAIKNARAWLDAVQQSAADEKWSRLDPVRSRTPWASIKDILERYESRATGSVKMERSTAVANANCLRQLLRVVTGTEDPDQLRADVLTEATARTYIEKRRAAKHSESSTKSSLSQARSVFSPAILYIYDGLKLPDLSGFRVAIRFNTGEDSGFEPIPHDAIARMEEAAIALRAVDPATWLVYMLMSRLGLRNIEMERATLSWLRQDESGNWHLDIPETKGGTARNLALPADLSHSDIRQIAATQENGVHLIPARTITERRTILKRTINRFVIQFLPGREKVSYELRKWAGSLVWSTQGSEAAQHFLGHRSMSTTERYYAKFLHPVRAVSAADRTSIYGAQKVA